MEHNCGCCVSGEECKVNKAAAGCACTECNCEAAEVESAPVEEVA